MKKYIKYFCGTLAIVSVLTACDSKLDVHNPNNFSDEQIEDLLKNGTDEERELILGGLTANLKGYVVVRNAIMGGGFTNMSIDNEWVHNNIYRNLQCGDIVYGDGARHSSGWGQYYRNSPDLKYWAANQTSECYGYWCSPSLSISNANKVLMFLSDEVVGESSLLKEYKAMALTLRGMGYLQLMERFTKAYLHGGKEGYGMPLYTNYGYQDVVAPSSAEESWNFILTDLKDAVRLFQESGYGYTKAKDHDTAVDIDLGLAQYFLAKSALWTGDYQTVIAACKDVLDNYGWEFIPESAYGASNDRMAGFCNKTDDIKADDNAFMSVAKNPECLFGWANDANIYTWTYYNVLKTGSDMVNTAYFQVDNALWSKMADNDYRKERFTTETATFPYFAIENGDTAWYPTAIPAYTCLKWAASIASDESSRRHDRSNSDVIIYRTSEVLLMMAEAQAQSGDESGAKATLNKLLAARTKAGTPTLTCDNYPAMQGMSALDMCKLQWRIECWGENGWNFWNSKRWNQAPVYEGSNHWSTTAVTIDHMTWEIPEQETQTNQYWANVNRK